MTEKQKEMSQILFSICCNIRYPLCFLSKIHAGLLSFDLVFISAMFHQHHQTTIRNQHRSCFIFSILLGYGGFFVPRCQSMSLWRSDALLHCLWVVPGTVGSNDDIYEDYTKGITNVAKFASLRMNFEMSST